MELEVRLAREMSTHRATHARPVEIQWLLGAAFVGAAVTGWLATAFWFFNATFSSVGLVLWPTSILLMGLANPAPSTEVILVWSVAGVANVALYIALGAVLSLMSYPVRKL